MGICKCGGCACKRREGIGTHSGGRDNVRAGACEREGWTLRTHVGCKGKIWSQRQVKMEEATGSEDHRTGLESHFKAEVTKFDNCICCVSNIISKILLSLHLYIFPSNNRRHYLIFTFPLLFCLFSVCVENAVKNKTKKKQTTNTPCHHLTE